jgi:AraC-like DNA-binding protein
MSEILNQTLIDSEENWLNTTFWDIQPLFLLVRSGKTDQLKEQLHIRLENFPSQRITKDERKQLEYLTVSLVNTFMIAAIQGGVYPPHANAVADEALRRLARLGSVAEIPALIHETSIEMCGLVRQARKENTGNRHVEKAKQYISTHLTQEISAAGIAEAVGVSPYHLSRLFHSMTGLTMKEYLLHERIEAACRLLTASEKSIPEISSLLRFCDQSHFTAVFRRLTGTTPGRYRTDSRK